MKNPCLLQSKNPHVMQILHISDFLHFLFNQGVQITWSRACLSITGLYNTRYNRCTIMSIGLKNNVNVQDLHI